jgi:twitching motility protein PilU
MDTPYIKDLIKKGQTDHLKPAMEQGIQEGCQTFDHVLFEFYRDGKIDLDHALINADSANNLRLKVKLAGLGEEAPPKPGAAPPPAGAKDQKAPGFQIRTASSTPPPGVRKP